MGPPLSCQHRLLARLSLSCRTQPKFDRLLVEVVREKEHEVRFVEQRLASECLSKARGLSVSMSIGGEKFIVFLNLCFSERFGQ